MGPKISKSKFLHNNYAVIYTVYVFRNHAQLINCKLLPNIYTASITILMNTFFL